MLKQKYQTQLKDMQKLLKETGDIQERNLEKSYQQKMQQLKDDEQELRTKLNKKE